MVFDSNGGFALPNGAVLAQDASWVSRSSWEALSEEQRLGFATICPGLVIELRSQSDRLPDLQAKMAEYKDNGIQLGWLIDQQAKRVVVYRVGDAVEVLDGPGSVPGDPALPGFALDLSAIW